MKFSELDLPAPLLQALTGIGYESLTPVQEATFTPIRTGQDVLAMAETGSGKTAACVIPLLCRLDPAIRQIQALILVPTRELAQQYVGEIGRLAEHTGIVPFAVFGGFSMGVQKAKLTHGVHVLVATPGRLIDIIYKGDLSLAGVRTLVLDEADEMLDMGFIDDVDFVLSCLTHQHQTLLFSATMPPPIERLVHERLHEPVRIELNRLQTSPDTLQHTFQMVDPHLRYEVLKDFLEMQPIVQAIIFCNSRITGEKLYTRLKGDRCPSLDYIHGGLEQDRRTSIYDRFKRQGVQFMVATDVAGRGLDFSNVSHVINFDFPPSVEAYTHRTGRTARMGRIGTALTLMSHYNLRDMSRLLGAKEIKPIWIGQAPDIRQLQAPPPGDQGGHFRPRRGGPGGGRRSGHRGPRGDHQA
jgi:ATP-dependent RNA helicase DeaD